MEGKERESQKDSGGKRKREGLSERDREEEKRETKRGRDRMRTEKSLPLISF